MIDTMRSGLLYTAEGMYVCMYVYTGRQAREECENNDTTLSYSLPMLYHHLIENKRRS